MQVFGKAFQSYGTLEAATTIGGYPGTNFAVSLSANGSPISGESSLTYPSGVNHSPGNNIYSLHVSDSSYMGDLVSLKHKIREIKITMLGPEPDIAISSDNSVFGVPSEMSYNKDYLEQMMVLGLNILDWEVEPMYREKGKKTSIPQFQHLALEGGEGVVGK
ncbi:hypothetical protein POM88_025499 [Heracleum sosnowskyi]|uniref:Uncharacterized protein n=1 Tax=Heracleum sosnowskyi TaxID=360622 RepID=A0AAD8I570_9APIA|nr:hypothetical protein POM88_025499 [Heracleum sosnowskyi]